MNTAPDPRVKYPELHDSDWLRRRYVLEGRTAREISRLVGSSDVAVCRQLKRLGISRPAGWSPPAVDEIESEPMREFTPLGKRFDIGELADLEADVDQRELSRRLAEGLEDFAELARLAAELPRERLWGFVVDRVDAPTARAAVFAAAAVAAEQVEWSETENNQRRGLVR